MIHSRAVDVDYFLGNPETAAAAVLERARSGLGGYACFANVHVVMEASRCPELAHALESAWAVFPDGAPVAWLQRRAGSPAARRIAGPDLMVDVVDRGCSTAVTHFLFGSTPHVLRLLEANLRCRYPNAQFVGAFASDHGREHDAATLTAVRAAGADVVWVALGAPKQELWMQRHAESLRPSLLLGVGAAFDFYAQTKRRAPLWMRRTGLEWVHRLLTEPRRLGWRYLSTNSLFLLDVVRRRAYH